eukprot:COSAG02_NODE_6953_length_3265_cov_3.225837_1_plen_74_part_00
MLLGVGGELTTCALEFRARQRPGADAADGETPLRTDPIKESMFKEPLRMARAMCRASTRGTTQSWPWMSQRRT